MGAPPRRRELLLSIIDELGEVSYETLVAEMRERSGEPDLDAVSVRMLISRLVKGGVLVKRRERKPDVVTHHIEYKDRILDFDPEARVRVVQEVPVEVTRRHRPRGTTIAFIRRAK